MVVSVLQTLRMMLACAWHVGYIFYICLTYIASFEPNMLYRLNLASSPYFTSLDGLFFLYFLFGAAAHAIKIRRNIAWHSEDSNYVSMCNYLHIAEHSEHSGYVCYVSLCEHSEDSYLRFLRIEHTQKARAKPGRLANMDSTGPLNSGWQGNRCR